jgi:transposase
MISLPSGTRVWIAAGATDMRRGFDGLASLVQGSLHEDPFSGHVFVFRGRKGDGFAPALQDHGYQLVYRLPFTEHPR